MYFYFLFVLILGLLYCEFSLYTWKITADLSLCPVFDVIFTISAICLYKEFKLCFYLSLSHWLCQFMIRVRATRTT